MIVTLQKLSSLIAEGSEVKATLLSETSEMAAYEKANGKSHISPVRSIKTATCGHLPMTSPEVKAARTSLPPVTPADSGAEQVRFGGKRHQQGGGNQGKDRKVEQTGNRAAVPGLCDSYRQWLHGGVGGSSDNRTPKGLSMKYSKVIAIVLSSALGGRDLPPRGSRCGANLGSAEHGAASGVPRRSAARPPQ